mmetsp:Transcript_3283/g.10151  ORF Transcript_3283/g.10151 Transcript_3283/m.10151 type:complete len:82 (+) Transcript_3283:344-589(+)|eukprot:scaffold202302_cov30-Tisochrysis_lutea.AAC.3
MARDIALLIGQSLETLRNNDMLRTRIIRSAADADQSRLGNGIQVTTARVFALARMNRVTSVWLETLKSSNRSRPLAQGKMA